MDVVSDEPSAQPNAKSDTEIPMSVANTNSESDSIPDHIVLPCDPDIVPPTAESDTERPMSVANTDSESDSNIILPRDTAESPMAMWHVIGGSGAFTRDPNTGCFTPASFSIFSDQVLD